MPIVTQVICDRCPKIKGEKNGWWVLYQLGDGAGFGVIPYDEAAQSQREKPNSRLLCSVEHLCEEIRMRTEKAAAPISAYRDKDGNAIG